MRVLFVIESLGRGGAERQLRRLQQREEDGQGQQHDADGLDEHAEHQQRGEHREQDHQRRGVGRGRPGDHPGTGTGERENLRKCRRHHDDHERHDGDPERAAQASDDGVPGETAKGGGEDDHANDAERDDDNQPQQFVAFG